MSVNGRQNVTHVTRKNAILNLFSVCTPVFLLLPFKTIFIIVAICNNICGENEECNAPDTCTEWIERKDGLT